MNYENQNRIIIDSTNLLAEIANRNCCINRFGNSQYNHILCSPLNYEHEEKGKANCTLMGKLHCE